VTTSCNTIDFTLYEDTFDPCTSLGLANDTFKKVELSFTLTKAEAGMMFNCTDPNGIISAAVPG
jgi:hypothetical protein